MSQHTPFSLRGDVVLVPAGRPATRYVLLTVTAPEHAGGAAGAGDTAGRRPSHNVSFVLDRSGSMGGAKIDLAREAVARALGMLRRDDRFSLVVYDNVVDVVVGRTEASAEATRNAVARLAEIEARGTTDLEAGWRAGCEQAAPHVADEPAGRCLLLTDGLANAGLTDQAELVARAAALRDRHIVTSTFGVGADFDEELLQKLAAASGGHFYFIEHPAQIPDLLTSELGEALDVVAHGATAAVQLPAGVTAEPLTRLEWCPTDGGIRVALGDLVSGQQMEVVLKLTVPAAPAGRRTSIGVTLADREGTLAAPPQELSWTSADADAVKLAPRDLIADRAVAALYAAAARQEALALNRAGEFARARDLLLRIARRIQRYAGDDAELAAIVGKLKATAGQVGEQMQPLMRKAVYFQSVAALASRAPDGKARRQGESR